MTTDGPLDEPAPAQPEPPTPAPDQPAAAQQLPAQPAVAWVQPAGDGGPMATTNVAGLWLIAIVVQVVVVFTRVRPLLGSELSSRDLGYIVGTALAGPVIALAIRWIYVRVRGGGPVLRSRWVPIAIIVMAGASLLGGLRGG